MGRKCVSFNAHMTFVHIFNNLYIVELKLKSNLHGDIVYTEQKCTY